MLYFAEIVGRPVATDAGAALGKLADLVFIARGQPLVTKLVVSARDQQLLVPTSAVAKINNSVTVRSGFTPGELSANELFVRKNLLDQQIIDIKGNKVVRVNDVAIQEKPYLAIAGVDVGILGLLRWFKLEQAINKFAAALGRSVRSRFLPWTDIQPLELSRGKVMLKMEEEKLKRIPPEDLADHLEKMNVANITKILDILDPAYEAEVIENLNPSFQQSLFRRFHNRHAAAILAKIDPDEAADILLTLPPKRREGVLTLFPKEKRREIERLLSLSQTPIGDLITTTDYLIASPEQTARAIMADIKTKTADFSYLNYVYIVNRNGQLVGVFNLHELLLQSPDTPLYKFMVQNIVALHLTTPLEIAVKRMLKYKLRALPVIDERRQILGIVTFDDLTESVLPKVLE